MRLICSKITLGFAVVLAALLSLETLAESECDDPVFSRLEVGNPQLGAVHGDGQDSVACLLECILRENKHSQLEVAQQSFAGWLAGALSQVKVEEMMPSVRESYPLDSNLSPEVCYVFALQVPHLMAAALILHEPGEGRPKKETAHEEDLTALLLAALNTPNENTSFPNNYKNARILPTILMQVDSDEPIHSELKRMLEMEAENYGFISSKSGRLDDLTLYTKATIDAQVNFGYRLDISFRLFEPKGEFTQSFSASSKHRVNQLTPGSQNNLILMAMADAKPALASALDKGKQYVQDHGALLRIVAGSQSGIDQPVLFRILQNINITNVQVFSNKDAGVVADVRFVGSSADLIELLNLELDRVFATVGRVSPSITFSSHVIAIQ
jgi:hypothetical protein